MLATSWKAPDDQRRQGLLSKSFALTASLFHRLQVERKEASIPGCTPQQDGLFTQQDIKEAAANARIHYKGFPARTAGLGTYSFPPLLTQDVARAKVSKDKAGECSPHTCRTSSSEKAKAAPSDDTRAVAKAAEEPRQEASLGVCISPRSQIDTPFFLRLRSAYHWWVRAGAPHHVLQLIAQGVHPQWPCPQLTA